MFLTDVHIFTYHLLNISLGPNIKFCGGWADNPDRGASIDVFETHFACLDVAGRHRVELAKSLCSLSRAIKLLPLYVVATYLSAILNDCQIPYSELRSCY